MDLAQIVGTTAAIDAVLAGGTWWLVRRHQQGRLGPPSELVSYFMPYLLWTTAFLVLTAAAMLGLTGAVQALVILLSDVVLWVSLGYFIMVATVGRPRRLRVAAMIIFAVLAAAGTLYFIAGMVGKQPSFGPAVTYVLSNMAPLLMYLVWLPSALLFFEAALRSRDQAARVRFLLLAVGLVLIAASWAWRLLVSDPPVLWIVVASIAGFAGILGGVVYGGSGSRQRAGVGRVRAVRA